MQSALMDYPSPSSDQVKTMMPAEMTSLAKLNDLMRYFWQMILCADCPFYLRKVNKEEKNYVDGLANNH